MIAGMKYSFEEYQEMDQALDDILEGHPPKENEVIPQSQKELCIAFYHTFNSPYGKVVLDFYKEIAMMPTFAPNDDLTKAGPLLKEGMRRVYADTFIKMELGKNYVKNKMGENL